MSPKLGRPQVPALHEPRLMLAKPPTHHPQLFTDRLAKGGHLVLRRRSLRPLEPLDLDQAPGRSGSLGTKLASRAAGSSRSSRPRVSPRCSAQTTGWFSRTASR